MGHETLWSDAQAARATKGRATASFLACGVQIDSREVAADDVFIAIEGENQDGHRYIADAAASGAAAAVVSNDWAERTEEPPLPLLTVPDTYQALYDLAAAARSRSRAKRIAVTGSMGKTGTKESLAAALRRLGKTHHTLGNQNNRYGLPLTLARLPESADYGVFEIGMDHAGEIEPLSELLEPHVAIITTIGPVHLEFFESVEGIADAKSEIFAGLGPEGLAILPRDSEWYDHLLCRAKERGVVTTVSFGSEATADYHLLCAETQEDGTNVVASTPKGTLRYWIGMPGAHWAVNSLAVLAAVDAVGGDTEKAALAFQEMTPGAGRGERTVLQLPAGGTITVIDESYNANPASVNAALQVARMAADAAEGRCIAVLGDIRELGDAAPQMHADLAPRLLANRVDMAFLCGEHMAHLAAALLPDLAARHTLTSADLVDPLADALKPNDVVVIKGSLGTNMRPIVDALLTLDAGASAGEA